MEADLPTCDGRRGGGVDDGDLKLAGTGVQVRPVRRMIGNNGCHTKSDVSVSLAFNRLGPT